MCGVGDEVDVQEVGGQIWWSGWDGSYIGWVREEVRRRKL